MCSIMLNILGEADGEEGASQADAIMEHAQEVRTHAARTSWQAPRVWVLELSLALG